MLHPFAYLQQRMQNEFCLCDIRFRISEFSKLEYAIVLYLFCNDLNIKRLRTVTKKSKK